MMHDENPDLENKVSTNDTPQTDETVPAVSQAEKSTQAVEHETQPMSLVTICITDEGLEEAKTLLTAWVPDVPLSICVVTSKESHVAYLEQHLASDDTFTLSILSETTPLNPGHIYVLPPNSPITILNNTLAIASDSKAEPLPGESFLTSYAKTLKQKAFVLFFGQSLGHHTAVIKLLASCSATIIQHSPQRTEKELSCDQPIRHLIDQSTSIRQVAVFTQRFIESFNPDSILQLEEDPKNISYVQHITSILEDYSSTPLSHFNPRYILFHVFPRMRLNGFDSIHQYIEKLASDKGEATQLARRISIKTTFFFSDLRSLRVIAKTIIPSVVKEKGADQVIRIWVPKCSSGEDILSLSMLIHEHADSPQTSTNVQLLGTDDNEAIIDFARNVKYSVNSSSSIPDILKEKFFTLEDEVYQYEPDYVAQCHFSVAHPTTELPHKDVDIIYCKDVLSRLTPEAQTSLLEQLKEALAPNGVLVLGSNEGEPADLSLFAPVKNQPNIYKPIQATIIEPKEAPSINLFKDQDNLIKASKKKQEDTLNTKSQKESPIPANQGNTINTLHKDLLIQIQAPVSLMIRPDFSIVDHIGNVGRFIAWPNNGHTHNMLEAFPQQVQEDLRFAVNQVLKSRIALKSRPINTKYDGIFREFRLQVHPINLDGTENSLIQVIFVETESKVGKSAHAEEAKLSENTKQAEDSQKAEELETIKVQLDETKKKFKVVSDLLKDSKELLKQSKTREQKALKQVELAAKKNSTEEYDKIARQNKELRSTNNELLELNRDLVRRIEELRRTMNRKLKEIEAERTSPATNGTPIPDQQSSPLSKNLELLLPKRHEVRTSLTSIIGFADLLAERIVDKDNRELAKYIGNSGHRLSENLAPLLSLEFADDAPPQEQETEETRINEDIVSSDRVLVVEDSDATRRLLTLVLSDRFECVVASDGSEAIAKAEKEIFKAVLLDIDLGKGPNGIDVLDHLRQKNYYRTVPFMAVTSMATPQDRSMLLRKGFDAFVPKPFQKGLLLSTLDKIIDNSTGIA